MENFEDFLLTVTEGEKRERTRQVLDWVKNEFPQLDTRIAWNTPHFTHKGTFIAAFSVSAGHLAMAPEKVALDKFSPRIKASGYDHGSMLYRMPWKKPVDFELLRDIIGFNIKDKEGLTTYWRK